MLGTGDGIENIMIPRLANKQLSWTTETTRDAVCAKNHHSHAALQTFLQQQLKQGKINNIFHFVPVAGAALFGVPS